MKNTIIIAILFMATGIVAQNYKFGKVSKKDLEEKFYPLDSIAEAAYLFRTKSVSLDINGAKGWELVTKVHEKIKIYNKKGYKYATKSIRLYKNKGLKEKLSKFRASTYSFDEKGKIKKNKLSKKDLFKEEVTQNWNVYKFTMPNLKKGCVIEWEYTTRSPYWTYIKDIVLQDFIPIKNTKVFISIPEYFVFKKHQKGFLPIKLLESKKSNSVQLLGNKTVRFGRLISNGLGNVTIKENVYKINQSNIPALAKENYVNNIYNYVSKLTLELSHTDFPGELSRYYSTTWEDVSKIIYKSTYFGDELAKKSYFKNDIHEVLRNKKTESEKLMAVFQFVKSKVKWNHFTSIYRHKGVRNAYKDGVGNVADINLMLTSMLRVAGLNANPVLVSTRSHGVPIFPTIKGFNYVIAEVELNNGAKVLLDATEPYSFPNILPERVLNWQGRLIKKGGYSKFTNLVSKKFTLEDNNVNVKIFNDGKIEGIIRSRYTNQKALKYRQKNNALKDEDRISALEEKYKVEINNLKISNKYNLSKPIGQIIAFESEDLIEKIDNKIYVSPLLFLASKINPFKSKTRNYPIDFVSPWKEKNAVVIQFSEGYKVTSLPEPLAIKLPENIGVFKYQVKQVGNNLRAISILQFNTAIIGVQYYQDLKEFYKKIIEKQSEKIILEKI